MKIPRPDGFLIPALVLSAAVMVYCAIFQIPSGEGFNPSDDGVVLAQSWRILNGEIPHRDFISIRPAGSGYMHLIDFLLPGPLQLSSRWFVIIEYLIYSILITILLIDKGFSGFSRRRKNGIFYVAASGIFLLNLNHYNLFAWTTIDALFWISISLFGAYRIRSSTGRRKGLYGFLAVSGAVISALCRQTFLLPALILLIPVARNLFLYGTCKERLAAAAGLIPGLLYAGMLTATGSWAEFARQLTGRTELWQTGFVAFSDNFWKSPVPVFFVLAFITGLSKIWITETGNKTSIITKMLITQKYISLVVIILLSFAVFLLPEHIFGISFGLFWMLIVAVLLVYFDPPGKEAPFGLALWIVFLSWTGALSLGDNAPVFTTGWLAGTALLLLLVTHDRNKQLLEAKWVRISGLILISVLAAISVPVQKTRNYRELPTAQLTKEGGEIFRDLDHIRLNPAVYGYLSDICRIYEESGSPQGRFAVWPNNPLIYRFLSSPNPFPLDWMQSAEWAGSEERLMREIRQILTGKQAIILVEKFNAKWIAKENIPIDWASGDYPYLSVIRELAVEVPSGSEWFRVFHIK